jgi:excisionase family DNA binding protein
MPSDAEIKLYTKADVARFMGLSERTIHRWIKAGVLPVVRFGRQVRIKQSDVVTLIQQHQEGGEQATAKGEPPTQRQPDGRLLALLESMAQMWQPGEGIRLYRLEGVRQEAAFGVVEVVQNHSQMEEGYPSLVEALQAWLGGTSLAGGQRER